MEDYHHEDGILTAGKNKSYWVDPRIPFKPYPPLQANLETDVVIVGGGLAGLSVAYCLTQAGKKVALVEDGLMGSGETGRTTAHLVTALDDRFYALEKYFNEHDAKLIVESHRLAIDMVESIVQKENIQCDFERVDGYLFLHPTDKEESLVKEFDAGLRAGVDIHTMDYTPGFADAGKCLRFANQAQFHPMKYLAGLCRAIDEKGGQLFTRTHASQINHKGITTDTGFTIKANHVVVATNAPVNDVFSMMLKQYAYRTYVIGALIKKFTLPRALWWDTGDHAINSTVPPYHYVRVCSYNDQYDLLMVGGEDHITGGTFGQVAEEGRYALLEAWARKHIPMENVIYRWSGEVLEPMDGIAFIGRNPWDHDNVYIVTGDSGNGMTHCSFAGMLITDLILGRENKWEQLYKPIRFRLKASGPFFKLLKDDFVNVLKKWFYTDTVELASIGKGEAKVVMMEGQKCGAFRDSAGVLHIVSTECTHLKCMVVWNNDEQSWDCPCHGSRFTFTGKVINGPAINDLESFSAPLNTDIKISV
jgi:glycine/D-amino acid oxidase-like deaminating enzyme/nitrite reductase/ring-hydroxylating ferredoxin subunit